MFDIMPTTLFLWVVGICVIPEARRLKNLDTRAMDILGKHDLWQITADLPSELAPIYDATGKMRGHIRMRGLSGAELTEYQQGLTINTRDGKTKTNMKRAMAKLIILCACNDDGSPYFEEGDMFKVDAMPSKTLMPLFEMAQKLCGLTDEDVREMTEDFTPTQNGHSTSDSPSV